jgi:nicotinamide-nucleotide amidase
MDPDLEALAREVGRSLEARGLMLATAESCTGGWVAKVVTDVAGSSGWFDRGFVTYSNHAKEEMLGVHAETLTVHGAVSEAAVREMAAGTLARSRADVAVAISGVAGPSGGTPEKPVGLVWFAWAVRGEDPSAVAEQFAGDRDAVRRQSVLRALVGVQYVLAGQG